MTLTWDHKFGGLDREREATPRVWKGHVNQGMPGVRLNRS